MLKSKKLQDTAAGCAVNEEIAKARERHQTELNAIRIESEHAQEVENAEMVARTEDMKRQMERKLEQVDRETEQLCATRQETERLFDQLEAQWENESTVATTNFEESTSEKWQRRSVRAFRWFGRFAAMGGAVTLSVLSAGAMAPLGMSLIEGVEAVFQNQKNRELMRRQARAVSRR